MTTTDTRTDAHRYAEAIADELVGVAAGRLEGYDPDDRVDALMIWMNDLGLDVEVTRNLTTGDLTAVDVLRTYGGPTCRVRFDHYTSVTVRVWWWGDEAETTLPDVDGHDLADLMLDLMAEVGR